MSETIREHFKHRRRRALAAVGIGIAVAAAAASCALAAIGGNRLEPALLAVAVLGMAITFAGLLYFDRTRCPKCRWRLGPVLNARGVNFCMNCGVNLDTPLY
jgi:hypothetical protein